MLIRRLQKIVSHSSLPLCRSSLNCRTSGREFVASCTRWPQAWALRGRERTSTGVVGWRARMPPRRRGGGDHSSVKKGPWSPEEDEVLRLHVEEHGTQDWSSIQSKGLLCRSGKSCRLRWVNKLQPGLKVGKFSPEEERVVLGMQAEVGNKWAEIATHLPGRTDNDVKNFWSTRQKRLARRLLEPPPPRSSRRAGSQKRGCSASSSSTSPLSHHESLRAPQEPSSSMVTFQATTYDVGQSSSQEPDNVDAPLPGVLCLPAPGDTAMETEPSSSGMVPLGAYAEHPVPDLALLQCNELMIPCIFTHSGSTLSQQEPSSSMISFQNTMLYEVVGQSSIPEPREATRSSIDAPLFTGALCLTAPATETEPGSSGVFPLGSHAVTPVPGAGAGLASLHYAAFVEPLAAVPSALSFSPDDDDGMGVRTAPRDDNAHYVVEPPREVVPAVGPLRRRPDDERVAACRDTTGVRFELLAREELEFFAQL